MAPGGRQPFRMEIIKTQRLPAPKKAIKPLMQCVSYSAAASGPHTGYQGTDAVTNLPGSPYSVRQQLRHPPKGWVLRAGAPALSGVFLPLFFLRRRRKNGAPGGR